MPEKKKKPTAVQAALNKNKTRKEKMKKANQILDENKHYMNPNTGSVQSGEDWICDQNELGFDFEELENLIEVLRDENDNWVEVE